MLGIVGLNFYISQGNLEESEAMYLRAISLRNSGLYWSNLGVLYHRANRKEKAVSAYKTALSLDQNIQSARVNLEKILSANKGLE